MNAYVIMAFPLQNDSNFFITIKKEAPSSLHSTELFYTFLDLMNDFAVNHGEHTFTEVAQRISGENCDICVFAFF